MDIRTYIGALGFVPKDGTNGVYQKIYTTQNNYTIEVDFNKRHIDYGDKITAESRTTQNFSQPENFVVLECIDKLLQKGYAPQNIILEKTWPSGHGTSGRLDICVNRNDRSPYLLIECKTYGKEFNKELARIHKDGGQLFTYFQLSGCKADVLMLYASEFKSNNFICTNEIIKIEDEYRSGEVKDIYEKWNKLTKDNGIFDSWVQPYNFQSKALTKEQLREIKAEDSSFISTDSSKSYDITLFRIKEMPLIRFSLCSCVKYTTKQRQSPGKNSNSSGWKDAITILIFNCA